MPLRRMTSRDLNDVNQILSRAFSRARWEEGYKAYRIPQCRIAFLELYLQRFPAGSLVAEHRNLVIGFVFSHLWGRVGWLGPLAVDPAFQGRGYGKALVRAAVDALKMAGARTIGLETMPRNYRNIDFYTALNFDLACLTVDLSRPLGRGGTEGARSGYRWRRYRDANATDRGEFCQCAEALARLVDPHLGVADEIELTSRTGFGDSWLLYRGEFPVAFAIGHTEKYYPEERRRYLKVFLAGVNPSAVEEDLMAFLAMLENWAASMDLDYLLLRLPSRQRRAFHWLNRQGFHAVHSDVRFVLNGFEEASNDSKFYLNKWE